MCLGYMHGRGGLNVDAAMAKRPDLFMRMRGAMPSIGVRGDEAWKRRTAKPGAASNVSRDVCWVDLRSGSEFYFALLPILP